MASLLFQPKRDRPQLAHTYVDGYCELHLYEYDEFNRLTFDNWYGMYTYDGDNMRQTLNNYAQTTTEIYDGGNLVTRKQGTDTHAYIYGIEQEFQPFGDVHFLARPLSFGIT